MGVVVIVGERGDKRGGALLVRSERGEIVTQSNA